MTYVSLQAYERLVSPEHMGSLFKVMRAAVCRFFLSVPVCAFLYTCLILGAVQDDGNDGASMLDYYEYELL